MLTFHFKKSMLINACLATTLVGCASTPTPTYVSSAVYDKYDCNQLAQEYNRVVRAISSQNGGSVFKSTGVNVGVSAGRGGIYPSISMGVGTLGNHSNSALSRLLGEKDAITQAAKNKSCIFIMKQS